MSVATIMSDPFKICPKCGTAGKLDEIICVQCGHRFRTKFPNVDDRTIAFRPPDPNSPNPTRTPLLPNPDPINPATTKPKVGLQADATPKMMIAFYFVMGAMVVMTFLTLMALFTRLALQP